MQRAAHKGLAASIKMPPTNCLSAASSWVTSRVLFNALGFFAGNIFLSQLTCSSLELGLPGAVLLGVHCSHGHHHSSTPRRWAQ